MLPCDLGHFILLLFEWLDIKGDGDAGVAAKLQRVRATRYRRARVTATKEVGERGQRQRSGGARATRKNTTGCNDCGMQK